MRRDLLVRRIWRVRGKGEWADSQVLRCRLVANVKLSQAKTCCKRRQFAIPNLQTIVGQ